MTPGIIAKTDLAKEVEYYLYNHIREDADDLYGFDSPAKLEIFETLLSVSGVGPKVAMLIVNELGERQIVSAIANSDANTFRSISGVGAKVAAKIIVELKSKISGFAESNLLPEEDETLDALSSLGYKKSEILPYLRMIPENLNTVQQKVKYVLTHVSKLK